MAKTKQGSRIWLFVLLGAIAVGVGLWWFVFRDTSAASVDSVEAAEARQAAIDDAAAADPVDDAAGADQASTTDDDAAAEAAAPSDQNDGDAAPAEADVAQPDAAAAIASPNDGTWQVDTSIGTFGPECLDVVCSSSFVGFRINEELAGFGAKTVVGRTPAVSGTVEIVGTTITDVSIVADMTQVLTDDPGRTQAIRGASGGLETDRFPEASFVLAEPIELGATPAEGSAVAVTATGDLTVHGVTQRVELPLTAEQQAGLIVVYGELADIALADFDIPKPTSVVVLSVEEIATMEFQLFFSR